MRNRNLTPSQRREVKDRIFHDSAIQGYIHKRNLFGRGKNGKSMSPELLARHLSAKMIA